MTQAVFLNVMLIHCLHISYYIPYHNFKYLTLDQISEICW